MILIPGQKISETGKWIKDLVAECEYFRDQIENAWRSLSLAKIRIRNISAQRSRLPSRRDETPILQPPKPTITPAAKILELARDQDATPEATD